MLAISQILCWAPAADHLILNKIYEETCIVPDLNGERHTEMLGCCRQYTESQWSWEERPEPLTHNELLAVICDMAKIICFGTNILPRPRIFPPCFVEVLEWMITKTTSVWKMKNPNSPWLFIVTDQQLQHYRRNPLQILRSV